MEYLVKYAAQLGLILNMLPIWGYHVNDLDLFTVETAGSYGLWLGERFKSFPNIIWTLGGDRNPIGYEAIYKAMAQGLREGHGGVHLMTFHPGGGLSSARFFHNDDWLNSTSSRPGGNYTTFIQPSLQMRCAHPSSRW